MSVELTLIPINEEASCERCSVSLVNLPVDDGFDAEGFYDKLEALPSAEAPANLLAPRINDNLEPALKDRYGRRLRVAIVRDILSLEGDRGARATPRNGAALSYLRSYADLSKAGLDARVVLFWH